MIAWFTRNGVAANLVMLLLVIGGIASYMSVKRELFPQFSLRLTLQFCMLSNLHTHTRLHAHVVTHI